MKSKNVMIKQFVLTSCWVIICVVQLLLTIIQDSPLVFVIIFSLLLGCMLIFALNIGTDMVLKDDVYIDAKVLAIEYNRILIKVKKRKRTRVIKLGMEEIKTFQINQMIKIVESRRSGIMKGIKEL